jgi:hypothetical protein
MRSWFTLCCCLAALAISGVVRAGESPHLPVGPERPQFRGLPAPAPLPPRPVNPRPSSRLLLEDDTPLTGFDLDRDLTKRCRAGRFGQQRQHLYVVRLKGFTHGAVIGGRWGLYDPDSVAVPDLVYALRWQETGRCEVYVLRHLTG